MQVFFHTDKGSTCSDIGLKDLKNGRECASAVNYAKSFNLNARYLHGSGRGLSAYEGRVWDMFYN